jgi:putative phosphoesterase
MTGKIGIIADTHGNLRAWERAWNLVLKDSDLICHCGDMLYHGPKFKPADGYDPKALADALNSCPIPLVVTRGNADAEVDQLVLTFPVQQPYTVALLNETRLLVTHGHLLPLETTIEQCRTWSLTYLMTGHTHVPVCQRYEGLTHINPGTPTYPLSPDESLKRPTCAAIINGEVIHYDLGTGEPLHVS